MKQPKGLKHGQYYSATIDKVFCTGRISFDKNDSEAYLCQNKQDGCSADNKLGYLHSWKWDSCVKDFKLGKITEKSVIGERIGRFKVKSIGRYSIQVGCQKISKKDIKGFLTIMDTLTVNDEKPTAEVIRQMINIATKLNLSLK